MQPRLLTHIDDVLIALNLSRTDIWQQDQVTKQLRFGIQVKLELQLYLKDRNNL